MLLMISAGFGIPKVAAGFKESAVWQALFDSLGAIQRRAELADAADDRPSAGSAGGPDVPDSGAAA